MSGVPSIADVPEERHNLRGAPDPEENDDSSSKELNPMEARLIRAFRRKFNAHDIMRIKHLYENEMLGSIFVPGAQINARALALSEKYTNVARARNFIFKTCIHGLVEWVFARLSHTVRLSLSVRDTVMKLLQEHGRLLMTLSATGIISLIYTLYQSTTYTETPDEKRARFKTTMESIMANPEFECISNLIDDNKYTIYRTFANLPPSEFSTYIGQLNYFCTGQSQEDVRNAVMRLSLHYLNPYFTKNSDGIDWD